jgi:mRNA interferase MazF
MLADLDPVRGAEANKTRPVVVVSNDGANRAAESLGRGVVTVVPLTTNTSRIYPFQALVPAGECALDHDSKAQAEQVRAIDSTRLGARLGRLPISRMVELDTALRRHLSL